MWLSLILLLIPTAIAYFILSSRKNKEFWKKYGVPQHDHATLYETIQVFLGKKTLSDVDEAVYHKLGSTSKYCGFMQLGAAQFLVKDLDILKKIMIKDFDHFVDRRSFGSDTQPSVEKMIVNLRGEEWKGVRTSLSPTFTTGKIRRMMTYFNGASNEWSKHFMGLIRQNGGKSVEINVEQETTNYSVDVIASAVFGMNTGAINNPDSIFAKMTQQLSKVDVWATIRFGMAVNFPKLTRYLGIKVVDQEGLQFFESILSQGMKARMSGAEKRNDFLQLMAEVRKGDLKAEGSDELSAFEKEAMINDNEIGKKNWLNDDTVAIAQLIQFFFAGFSTTSNFIGFVMYCLALYPECQEKLRKEVNGKLFKDGNEEIDYDVLNQLEYLDMCACETLRKFPVLGRIERKCTLDYKDTENNFEIPKGVTVAIPIQAIHNDPKYYKYPDKFYPEHFTGEEKSKRNPYAFLPFGTGPRNCIGMRFALIESKAAIAHLIHNFEISPAADTPIPFAVKLVGIGVQLPNNLKLKLSPAKK